MADVTTTLLQLLLQETGNNNNSWGTLLNDTLSRIEKAIADDQSVSTTGGDTTLTNDQAVNAILAVSGTLSSDANIIVPTRTKAWIVKNGTSGAYTVTVKTVAGTGIVVPQGESALLYCDGTNVLQARASTFTTIDVTGAAGFGGSAAIDGSGNATFGTLGASGTATLASVTATGTMAQTGAATFAHASAVPVVVNRTGDTTARQIELQIAGTARGFIGANATYAMQVYLANGSTSALTIDTSSNLVATGNVSAYSDARVKKNIAPIYAGLHKVGRMKGVRYQRVDTDVWRVGLIAQELREVVPEAVLENDEGMLSISYGDLVGVLVEAIKELKARVETLESR